MADYVMLEDIFETTGNMTVLRDNRLNDDGTDTVTGVEWFRFRETTAASFYVSGNSWIGIGQNSEQLKISRRDADLYTLKREEGTLLEHYKFLRIRWEGYSAHGNNNASTRLIWDALFLIPEILSFILLKSRFLPQALASAVFTQNQKIYRSRSQKGKR